MLTLSFFRNAHIYYFSPFRKSIWTYIGLPILDYTFVFSYSNRIISLLLKPLLLNVGVCTICVIGRINIYNMFLIFHIFSPIPIWCYGNLEPNYLSFVPLNHQETFESLGSQFCQNCCNRKCNPQKRDA